MLLQVTHGSAFCSQQASYVRVGVWLTVVKGIHADISRARAEIPQEPEPVCETRPVRNFYVGTNDPRVILCLTRRAEELESRGLIPSSCNGVDGGIP